MDLAPLSKTARDIAPGLYEHYKGKRYRLLHIGRHTETHEEMVVYQQLYGTGDIWVRPLDMFVETVNGKPRFRFIE